MKQKSYIAKGWLLTLALALAVVALGYIPTVKVFGLELGRVDVFSTLRAEPLSEEVVEYEADLERLEQELAMAEAAADTLQHVVPQRYEWVVSRTEYQPRRLRSDDVRPDSTLNIIPIEDFDTLATTRFERLIEKLANGESVRIAFMGDSFVEGDIVTVDLREELQTLFGGRGVGFVPCDIPYATVRKSIKRSSKGWSSYSIMKPKAAPEALRNSFFVSGYLSSGVAGANTRWQTTDATKHIDSCTQARLLLISRDDSSVELTLSDTLKHTIAIEGDERLREIHIDAPYNSLAIKVLSGNVICYGASLEDTGGVTVDNFSVRSNNGHAIFGTSATINRQANDMLNYDLVVLQYGLNIMLPNQRNFSKYRDQLRDMIAYVERCFPEAAVLVLGVSDRWIKSEEAGGYVPIGSVDALTSYQRAAADSCRVAFWNTSRAMANYGGIRGFVANGWAAGDYTHINYAGGRRIAHQLAAALRQPVYELLKSREEAAARQQAELLIFEQQRQQRLNNHIEAISTIVPPISSLQTTTSLSE